MIEVTGLRPNQAQKISREWGGLFHKAVEQGWKFSFCGSGHLKWMSPTGGMVITAESPHGGKRSHANTRADLRRAGLQL